MISDRFSTIAETFQLLDEWQERYAYIIELGSKLPPFPPERRTSAHKVSGCVSQVWVTHTVVDGQLILAGDSDSHLVKGLMAIVFAFCSGQTPDMVAASDIEGTLRHLNLIEGLTPQRSNGLRALITTIKTQASLMVQA